MKSKKVGMLLVLSIVGIGIASCTNEENTNSSAPSSNEDNSTIITPSSEASASSTPTETPSSSNEPVETPSSSEEPVEDPTLVDGYRLITSMEELSSSNKVLIGAYSDNVLYGLTPNAKSSSLPWYLVGEALKEANDHKDIKDISTTAVWNVSKVGDTFQFSLDGKYLHSYVDSGHYSIGYIDNKEDTVNDWTITMDETGKAQIVSSKEVYLQYYKGSFCGAAPKYKTNAFVYFYTPAKIHVETETNPDTPSKGDEGVTLVGTKDDTNWKGINFNTYGNTFRNGLKQLIKGYRTQTTSYYNCLDIGMKAAAYGDSGNFVPFYHAAPNVTEGVTGNGAYATNNVKDGINREHTWPNSRGCGEDNGPGCDPFIIRPTLTNENSGRGNNFYGTENGVWDPASYGYEAARGEAARIMFYTATAYYGTCGTGGSSQGNEPLELSNNPSDATTAHTMGTLKELLKWNAMYPVTAMEKQINNYLASQGYGRNPFVDHPEYANQIWDFDGIRTKDFEGKDITTSEEPAVSIPELTPNGETVEILASPALTFGADGFSYKGIAVR